VAFLFPGQGSQYVGLGGQVAIHSDAAMGPWDAAVDPPLGGERLHDVMYRRPVFSEADRAAHQDKLTATERAQPAIGVTSLIYLALPGELGLTPDAVAGYSYGEVISLHVAGVYYPETMVRIARNAKS
jgi:(acyl-carrier-protein) S-malonyltransferase